MLVTASALVFEKQCVTLVRSRHPDASAAEYSNTGEVWCAVACGGVRAQRRQTRTALLCRTGVIHDPVKQTCIFDTEWSSGSSGGGRRLVEVIEPVECDVDPSEVTQELGEVKMELSEVKQQLRIAERAADDMKRKAEQVAEDMKRQVGDMSEELREVKALLKQLATAQ